MSTYKQRIFVKAAVMKTGTCVISGSKFVMIRYLTILDSYLSFNTFSWSRKYQSVKGFKIRQPNFKQNRKKCHNLCHSEACPSFVKWDNWNIWCMTVRDQWCYHRYTSAIYQTTCRLDLVYPWHLIILCGPWMKILFLRGALQIYLEYWNSNNPSTEYIHLSLTSPRRLQRICT